MFAAEYLLFCAGKSVNENGNLLVHGIFDRLLRRVNPLRNIDHLRRYLS